MSATCPRCEKPVDVKSRHVAVTGSAIKVYCSAACLEGIAVIEAPVAVQEEPPRRKRWWVAAGFMVGGAFVALTYVTQCDDGTSPEAYQELLSFTPPPPPPPAKAQPRPAQPSAEELARRADEELLKDLQHDAWIHPLAGPKRRMPWNHIQAFGAARVNSFATPECLSGHCGVDVGVDEPNIWGEPVHAVHEGTISWVDRGPNEEAGGAFVKIAHRDGGLFSWYFHLAAIPRWVRPGAHVKVGQVIGLVGDTGLRDPVPHLHFSMSVKPPKATRERYIDPEPLIAIWPLWIPDDKGGAHVTTMEAPGLPVRTFDYYRPTPSKPTPKKPAVASKPEPPKAEPVKPDETKPDESPHDQPTN
jgi:murein DD-endopeptidase MepM/ murein hydrolase activator NlpD